MEWCYGITTVPERLNDLLPRTIASLAKAGFDKPRIFLDGEVSGPLPAWLADFPLTHRVPRVRTYGSWMLAAWELYVRKPTADRYAFFQDDMVTYLRLREYLEECPFPEKGYWNLYTFSQNEKPIQGWYPSNQLGKGAVALIFSNLGLRTLLAQQYTVDRPLNPNRGWKALDGGIVSAYKIIGWKEYVHNPSLVQHTGIESSMGNRRQELARTFRGETYDAMRLSTRVYAPEVLQDPLTRRIGLVGHNCESDLGERNWELASHTDVSTWIVKPDGYRPVRSPHPDVDTIFCPRSSSKKLQEFLRKVEVVAFCEDPCYNDLIPMAKEQKKRIICITEQTSLNASWVESVDLFLCTTLDSYNSLKDSHVCVEFSWPSKWETGANTEFNLLARTGEHRIAIV